MKEKFIKSTIILLIGGILTKILGMIIKIIMAREIGSEGLGTYMLILPTFMLLISLSQFGIPLALSKLISENKRNNKKLIFSLLPLLILINILLIILIVLLSPIISIKLLHNKDTYISILSMALVIPFTTISAVCRSYFFGKEKMLPHVISNIVEDLVRLIIIITLIPIFKPLGLKYVVCFLILINIISEIASTLILLLFLPKNIKITKKDLKPNKIYIKDSLKISIPNTASKLIGSIGFFFEPIILTTFLLNNYSLDFITKEYGIISGFVIPLILLPSFFTLAISQALLPVISNDYVNKNIKTIKRKVKLAIALSLLIGLPVTIILIINPNFFLNTIYHTNEGITYTRILAPICLLQYIQSPLSSILDAIGKSQDNMISTLLGTIVRTLSLIIFSTLKIGLYSLIIAIAMNIIVTTFYQIKKVRKHLTF
ncbi:MAG: oligosaccharide flippase family protein [Bacilli bacterium]|nr:oligosaccharide flippase family protein [Bacilli bacterium]